jgi:hypothetical protein
MVELAEPLAAFFFFGATDPALRVRINALLTSFPFRVAN